MIKKLDNKCRNVILGTDERNAMKETNYIHMRIDEEFKRAVKSACAQRGLKITQLIRQLLEKWMSKKGERQ